MSSHTRWRWCVGGPEPLSPAAWRSAALRFRAMRSSLSQIVTLASSVCIVHTLCLGNPAFGPSASAVLFFVDYQTEIDLTKDSILGASKLLIDLCINTINSFQYSTRPHWLCGGFGLKDNIEQGCSPSFSRPEPAFLLSFFCLCY